MTKLDYAKYLANLIQINIYSGDLRDLSACFYGLFDEFLPYGDGVHKVFEPLNCGKELQDRIMPLYEANKAKANDWIKAGFSPIFSPPPSSDKARLTALGKAHIEDIKEFADFMRDKKLLKALKNVRKIEIQEQREAVFEPVLEELIYKAITKWLNEAEFTEEKAWVLKEAYRSATGDLLLANYLLYPALKYKPQKDFLKSRFEIFLLGHFCEFDKNKLNIYPPAV